MGAQSLASRVYGFAAKPPSCLSIFATVPSLKSTSHCQLYLQKYPESDHLSHPTTSAPPGHHHVPLDFLSHLLAGLPASTQLLFPFCAQRAQRAAACHPCSKTSCGHARSKSQNLLHSRWALQISPGSLRVSVLSSPLLTPLQPHGSLLAFPPATGPTFCSLRAFAPAVPSPAPAPTSVCMGCLPLFL